MFCLKKLFSGVLGDLEQVLVDLLVGSEAVLLLFSSWMKLAFLTNTTGKIPVRR